MDPIDGSPVTRRRRGRELENALLDAAWAELVEVGYSGFTIDSVAKRAQTSRAVLYRRWATKQELVRAAVGHGGSLDPVVIPDTGSLREDTVQLLRSGNQKRARLGITLLLQLSDYYVESGTGLADLRSTFLEGRQDALGVILERAVQRGEADPARLTPRVVGVPFDLYRQELLMTLRPVPEDVIDSIVDEVFLPLVRVE